MPQTSGVAGASGTRKYNSLDQHLGKTKLCHFHVQGLCTRGSRCTFAHGDEEMSVQPNLIKTRMCMNFQQGKCNYPYCNFAHSYEELRSTDFCFKTSMCVWHASGKCRNGTNCRFAHGVNELRMKNLDTPQGESDIQRHAQSRKEGRLARKAVARAQQGTPETLTPTSDLSSETSSPGNALVDDYHIPGSDAFGFEPMSTFACSMNNYPTATAVSMDSAPLLDVTPGAGRQQRSKQVEASQTAAANYKNTKALQERDHFPAAKVNTNEIATQLGLLSAKIAQLTQDEQHPAGITSDTHTTSTALQLTCLSQTMSTLSFELQALEERIGPAMPLQHQGSKRVASGYGRPASGKSTISSLSSTPPIIGHHDSHTGSKRIPSANGRTASGKSTTASSPSSTPPFFGHMDGHMGGPQETAPQYTLPPTGNPSPSNMSIGTPMAIQAYLSAEISRIQQDIKRVTLLTQAQALHSGAELIGADDLLEHLSMEGMSSADLK